MKIPQEKIEQAMVSAMEHEPLVQALKQVLADFVADESRAALLPDLNSEARAYNCGRAAAIVDFRSLLVELGLKLDSSAELSN